MVSFLFLFLMLDVCCCFVVPVSKHHRTTTLLKAGGNVYPLQGDINQYCEYFVNISLGTPPQILRVQVDTGSTDLVVYGTGCHGCPIADNITWYNERASKSASMIICDSGFFDCDVNNCWEDFYCPMNIQYGGGGSIQGYAVQDTFALGDLKARVSLGVIEDLHGPFENLGVDGCWGFAFQELSSWGDNPVIYHLYLEKQIPSQTFSLCLTPDNAVMDLGVSYKGDTRFEWTNIRKDWYSVTMTDFFVNNTSIGLSQLTLNSEGVIVDSGTTLVILSKKIMTAVQSHFSAMCDKVYLVGVCNATAKQSLFDGYCFEMSPEQIASFPPVSLTLKGTSQLIMYPEDYLWLGTGDAGVYCLGFQSINNSEIPVILGDILLQKYHVVFDRDSGKVGFGSLDTCPTLV